MNPFIGNLGSSVVWLFKQVFTNYVVDLVMHKVLVWLGLLILWFKLTLEDWVCFLNVVHVVFFVSFCFADLSCLFSFIENSSFLLYSLRNREIFLLELASIIS